MRTLICLSAGHFEYGTAEIPNLKNGEALIRLRKVGICGTDLHVFEATRPYFTYPRFSVTPLQQKNIAIWHTSAEGKTTH